MTLARGIADRWRAAAPQAETVAAPNRSPLPRLSSRQGGSPWVGLLGIALAMLLPRTGEADLTDNLRIAADASYRSIYRDAETEWSHLFAFGFDVHKVFSSSKGDIGTFVFQPYALRTVNINPPPPFFDEGANWGLQWRIANFNLTALAKNRFNIRVGHFRVPFGLEHLTPETQGRLRNYTTIRGFRADWGATFNGVLPFGEYEVGWSRGSGNDWDTRGDPYLVSGRIGSPRNKRFVVGASFQTGDIHLGPGIVGRTRGGVDMSYFAGPFSVRADFSVGEDDDRKRWALLTDFSYLALADTLDGYTQVFITSTEFGSKWEETYEMRFGVRWEVNRVAALSTELRQPIEAAPNRSERPTLFMQLRFRFQ